MWPRRSRSGTAVFGSVHNGLENITFIPNLECTTLGVRQIRSLCICHKLQISTMCCPIASRMIIRAKRQHSLRVRSALHLRRKCAMSTSNMRGSQLVPQDHRIPARDPLLPHEYTADSSRARPMRDRCTAYFQLMTCVTVYAAYWAELSAYRRTWTYTKRLRYT